MFSQLRTIASLILLIDSRPSDHYFRSVCWFVCLFVCLCRVFLSRLWSDFDQTRTYVNVWDSGSSLEYMGCATPGAGWPLKSCIFRGLSAEKLSCPTVLVGLSSFDRILGYIVERTNTKILSSHFFAISVLNPKCDVINDVISAFAKSCRRAMRFSPLDSSEDFMGRDGLRFLYLL